MIGLKFMSPPINNSATKFKRYFAENVIPSSSSSNFKLSFINKDRYIHESSFKCCCDKNRYTHESSQGFSVLSSDIPWDSGSVWSNYALYLFSLHIPLSFGGLSLVSNILHQHDLDPQTEALSLFVIQIIELIATLILLRFTCKSQFKLTNLFKSGKLSMKRNWLLTAALGFGCLILVVLLTSVLADSLMGPKTVNNPVLKEILSSTEISKTACILAYSLITPLLEETINRGFLLTSLASTMKWHHAVIISSAIFSASHFSGENFIQLFIIGFVIIFEIPPSAGSVWSKTISFWILVDLAEVKPRT